MRIATYQPRSIYDDVRPLRPRDYEKGLAEFIDEFRRDYRDDAAIYQFGEANWPGVSDIDLLIVTPDQAWRAGRDTAQVASRASDLRAYLFLHDPVVVCESLLPSLPILHTLDGCRQLTGDWDPLGDYPQVTLGPPMLFSQHVVWSSFMRIAALELDGHDLGLRRTLVLLNNLLMSAKSGNRHLDQPVQIDLFTSEVRARVLGQDPQNREHLCRTYIAATLDLLHRVDALLDSQYLPAGLPHVPPAVTNYGRHVLLTSHCPEPNRSRALWCGCGLVGASCIRVPAYLLLVTAALAARLAEHLPELAKSFAHFPVLECIRSRVSTDDYASHVSQAVPVFARARLAYCFPLPFAHTPVWATSLRTRLGAGLRSRALRLAISGTKGSHG